MIPDTLTDLQLAGYRYIGPGSCKKCSAAVLWFFTRNNCRMPFSTRVDVMVDAEGKTYLRPSLDKLEVHFAACPEVERSRRRKR